MGGGASGAAEFLAHSRDPRPRPGTLFNGVNAAFMSFQPHESGMGAFPLE
jgi:hypothetical protein